jgi:hypothetical protein
VLLWDARADRPHFDAITFRARTITPEVRVNPSPHRGGHAATCALAIALLSITAACSISSAPPPRSPRPVRTGGPAPLPAVAAGIPTRRTASAVTARPDVAWRIGARQPGGISGYADQTGVNPGEPVTLYVSTDASRFVVRAFRMGWYHGRLGEQLWRSGAVPGREQPGPQLTDAATGTYRAPWQPSLTVRTAGWPPGDYLLRLDAATGGRSFVPLTIRARSAVGRVVLISPVTTWQAYNLWGCCDLYAGGDGTFATRSDAVSFDRPYLMENGAGEFIRDELGVVAEAERLGLKLDYLTNVDLDARPWLVHGARAVVSMGHDEYWSPKMRATLTGAQADGTNLAFFGANAIFRRIRFARTPLGADRLEINYKIAAEDPLDGIDNAAVTADWPAPPDARPESALLGDQYGCLLSAVPVSAGVITRPASWMYRGVRVTFGERLPYLIGPEIDAIQRDYPTPPDIYSIMHSPAQCPNGTPTHADASYYVASSGAAVFDAGSINWACQVAPTCGGKAYPRTHAVVRQVTDNILRAFARAPS